MELVGELGGIARCPVGCRVKTFSTFRSAELPPGETHMFLGDRYAGEFVGAPVGTDDAAVLPLEKFQAVAVGGVGGACDVRVFLGCAGLGGVVHRRLAEVVREDEVGKRHFLASGDLDAFTPNDLDEILGSFACFSSVDWVSGAAHL